MSNSSSPPDSSASRRSGWEDRALCRYQSDKKTSFFNRKPKDEYREAFCKAQRRNGVLTFYTFKVKHGNILKPVFEVTISAISEITLLDTDGYAEMTINQVSGTVVRFLSFDSRNRCMAYITRSLNRRDSASPSLMTSSSFSNSLVMAVDNSGSNLANQLLFDDDENDEKNDTTKGNTIPFVANENEIKKKPKSSAAALAFGIKSFDSYEDLPSNNEEPHNYPSRTTGEDEDDEFAFDSTSPEHANDVQPAASVPVSNAAFKNEVVNNHDDDDDEDDEFSLGDGNKKKYASVPTKSDRNDAKSIDSMSLNEQDYHEIDQSIASHSPTNDGDTAERFPFSTNNSNSSNSTNNNNSVPPSVSKRDAASGVPVTIPVRKQNTTHLAQSSMDLPGPPQPTPISLLPNHATNSDSMVVIPPPAIASSSQKDMRTKPEVGNSSEQHSMEASQQHTSMAPTSSLLSLLVGTDKPMRKSHYREQQQQQQQGSAVPADLPLSSTTATTTTLPATTSSPLRNHNNHSNNNVELPTSEYDLAQSYHHVSLRGAALTTQDLKSPLQMHNNYNDHANNVAPIMRLSDIATNNTGNTHHQMTMNPNRTTFSLSHAHNPPLKRGATTSSDDHNHPSVLYLQKEIDQLVRMNDQLNAALERSELMRQEDMQDYEHRIHQLQSALEEMTVLSSSQPEFYTSAMMMQSSSHMNMETTHGDNHHSHEDPLLSGEDSTTLIGEKQFHQGHHRNAEMQQNFYTDKEKIQWEAEKAEMQELISMLSTQLQQQKDETSALLSESKLLQQATETFSGEFLQLEEARDALLSEKEEWRLEKQALENALRLQATQSTWQQQNHEREQKQLEIQQDLQSMRSLLEVSRSQEEHQKTTIVRLEKLVQEQQQLIKDLSGRLQHTEHTDQQQLQDHQLQLLTLQEENVQLSLQRAHGERELQRVQNVLEQQYKESAMKAQSYEEQLSLKQSSIVTLQTQIQQHNATIEHNQAEISVLSRRLQLSKDQETKLTQEIDLLTHRLTLEQQSLTSQLTSYRSSMDASKHAYDELFAKYQATEDTHRQHVRETQQSMQSLEDSVNLLKSTNQDLMTRNALLAEQNDSLSEQWQQEKNGRKKYKEQIHQLELQTSQERKQLTQKLQELTEKCEQQATWLLQHETQLKQSEESRRHIQDTMSQSLQAQTQRYQSAQTLYEQVARDLETLQEERRKEQRSYEETIRSLNRTVDALKANEAQLERQCHTLESDYKQLQQSVLSKTQDTDGQLKHAQDRIQELLREVHDTQEKWQSEEQKHQQIKSICDSLRHKTSAFVQLYQISLLNHPQEDLVGYVQDIFSWFTKTFNSLQDEVSLLSNTHRDQEDYYKRRITALEETIVTTSAAWKESQSKAETAEKKYLEQQSELQALQLAHQKREYTIQELNLQLEAGRRDYHHVLDQQAICEKEVSEEKQKVKSLEHALKLSKEKDIHGDEDRQQLQQQLTQIKNAKVLVEEQCQALQRQYNHLETQTNEQERTIMQQLKELAQEKMKNTDSQRQLEQLQRNKESLESELSETKQYWEDRYQTYTAKLREDETKWKELELSLEKELRQTYDRCAVAEEKIRLLERETQRHVLDNKALQEEIESMVPKVQFERVQKQFVEIESKYETERQQWRELSQEYSEKEEQLDRELLQYQRFMMQLQDLLLSSNNNMNTFQSLTSPTRKTALSSSFSSHAIAPIDLKAIIPNFIDRIYELLYQEKTSSQFFTCWLDAFESAGINQKKDEKESGASEGTKKGEGENETSSSLDVSGVDNTNNKENMNNVSVSSSTTLSYHFLQRLQVLLPQLQLLSTSFHHSSVTSPLLSSSSSTFSSSLASTTTVMQFQERCIVHFLQPLLREYEHIRQDYESTYYYYTTQLQDVERLTVQLQLQEEQIQSLRQQRQQQEELYRQNVAHFEQEQQRLFQEQESIQGVYQEEIKQLTQRFELSLQQAEQQAQRQQEVAARQLSLANQNELLLQANTFREDIATKVKEIQELQDDLQVSKQAHSRLEETVADKNEVIRRQTEEILHLQTQHQQQRQQLSSLLEEQQNLKRLCDTQEEEHETQATQIQLLNVEVTTLQEKLRTRSEQVRLLTEQIQVLEIEVAEESVAKEKLERQLERALFSGNNTAGRSTMAKSSINTTNTNTTTNPNTNNHAMTTGGGKTAQNLKPSATQTQTHTQKPSHRNTDIDSIGNIDAVAAAVLPADKAISSLVQRRKHSGAFSSNNTNNNSAKNTADNAAININTKSANNNIKNKSYFDDENSDDGDGSAGGHSRKRDAALINHPDTKLARLRNKIVSAQQEGKVSLLASAADTTNNNQQKKSNANAPGASSNSGSNAGLDSSSASAPPLRLQDLLHN